MELRAITQKIVEVKRHGDGSEHRYNCELVSLQSSVAIVQFKAWTERSLGGFHLPAGSQTYGLFWPRRSYSLYRMLNPQGELVAYRFDVLQDCRISADEVSYLDLLLDIWVSPSGEVQVEDEDDVIAWTNAGLLSTRQVRQIERTRDLLIREHHRICREALRLLESLPP